MKIRREHNRLSLALGYEMSTKKHIDSCSDVNLQSRFQMSFDRHRENAPHMILNHLKVELET